MVQGISALSNRLGTRILPSLEMFFFSGLVLHMVVITENVCFW